MKRAWQTMLMISTLAAARGVDACPGRATDVRMRVRDIEASVVHFQTETYEACPRSVRELVAEGILAREPLDPWGRSFVLVCRPTDNPDGVDVISMGADGVLGTADDIVDWDGPLPPMPSARFALAPLAVLLTLLWISLRSRAANPTIFMNSGGVQ